MPVYEFSCLECKELFEVTCPMADRTLPRRCPICNSENTQKIISLCGFVLKGDDWPGKNIRINGQMASKNRRLHRKKIEMKGDKTVPKLIPNVDGERVNNWSEAKRLASSKGKETSSYDSHIRGEEKERKGLIE